jgi:putative membrane protein
LYYHDGAMLHWILSLVISAVILLIISRMVSGFELDSFGSAVIAALIIGVVNAIVRPLLAFLTLPLIIVTLGLFLFVLNALMLKLASALVPGFRIRGFMPAIWGALLLAIANLVIDRIS